jgi:hypothetical protein
LKDEMDSPNAELPLVEPKTPSQVPHTLLFGGNPYQTPPSTYRRNPAANLVFETPTPLVPPKESIRIERPVFSAIKFQTVGLQNLSNQDDERTDGSSIAHQVSGILDEREQRGGLVALFLQSFPSLEHDTPFRTEFNDFVEKFLESDGSRLVLKEEALEAARKYAETLAGLYMQESGPGRKRKSEEMEDEESGLACVLDVADGRNIVWKLFYDQNGEEGHTSR